MHKMKVTKLIEQVTVQLKSLGGTERWLLKPMFGLPLLRVYLLLQ